MSSFAIIGGGGGVGAALTALLRARGDRVAIAGRDPERLQAAEADLAVVCDGRQRDDVNVFIEKTCEQLGGCDGAVNLAGSVLLKPAHRTSPDEYEAVIGTNLTTAFNLVAVAGGLLRDASVVLLGSAAGRHGFSNHEAIAAAKAGIEGLARSAAASYASRGLRVNVVAPGLVETGLTAGITGNDAMREASRRMHVAGRLGQPEDIARAIAFLLDPDNTWITGQVIGVDGGLGTVRSK